MGLDELPVLKDLRVRVAGNRKKRCGRSLRRDSLDQLEAWIEGSHLFRGDVLGVD